jgi:hypothetical protein
MMIHPMTPPRIRRALVALVCFLTGFTSVLAQGFGLEPMITQVLPDGTNLVVTVSVPDACRRISLESRPRLGQGGWIPRADRWPAPEVREVVFRIPITSDLELLRARGETAAQLPLPPEFYAGSSLFTPSVQTNSTPPASGPDGGFLGPVNSVGDGLTGAPSVDRSGSGGRTVAESDIWNLDGSTLYFFNSVRGLQVIDLSNPDIPLLRGTLGIAAHGEQMYLLPSAAADDRWIALLTTSACDWSSGEVILVNVRDGHPHLASRVPFPGQIRESRRVGSALYLATYRWSQVENGNEWRSETVILSIDLSDPTQPRAASQFSIPANPDAIQATDTLLMVATSGPATGPDNPSDPVWLRPGVHAVSLYDISDPDGTIVPRGSIRTRGRVQDKFKMHLNDDILTVISSRNPEWRMVTRTNWYWREYGPNGERLIPPVREADIYNTFEMATPSQTWLETFAATHPAGPTRLAELRIVEDETLFATRFVGDRAYVVTFRIIDPLWIIDISDPAKPAIRGELEIPGYSSYLEPIAPGRLLAVGVEGGNAAVALFDVSDDSNPRQLSKVFLGTGWSWSEANNDEKAFRYLPELGLVLIPWQGWENNTYVQAVQLVDLDGDRLIKRGVIQHQFLPRRATALDDRIVSISGQELLVVDATHRDLPEVTAALDLSFNVSRVRVDGDALWVLSAPWGKAPRVRRVAAATPEIELGMVELPNFPVVGFERIGSRLHVLQHEPDTHRQDLEVVIEPQIVQFPTPHTNYITRTNWIHVTVPGYLVAREIAFDGDTPVLLGESRVQRPEGYYGAGFDAHAAGDGLLLWTETVGYSPWLYGRPIDGIGRPAIGGAMIGDFWGGWGWWGWQNSMVVLAEDISVPGKPMIESVVRLGGTPKHNGFSSAFVSDRRLYVSHREYLTREEKMDPDDTRTDGIVSGDVRGTWWITETRHLLEVVDFEDPTSPMFREPLDLPAALSGLSHRGALLLTLGATSTNTPGRTTLQALAYDGIRVRQIDSIQISESSLIRALADGRVLATEPAGTNSPARLDAWRVGSDARWVHSASVEVPGPFPTLRWVRDVAVVEGGSTLRVIRPVADGMAVVGDAPTPCGYWGDWSTADAGPNSTLWLPRGDSGLLMVRPVGSIEP